MAQRIFSAVTSAASNRDLTTIDAVKQSLGLTDAGDDAYLAAAIAAASSELSRFCNRVFAAETLVDTIFLDRAAPTLVLSRSPVLSIASVVEAEAALPSNAYAIDGLPGKNGGTLARISVNGLPTSWAATKYIVTYRAGFEIIPDDLDRAAQRMVAHAYMAKQRDPSIRSIKIPDLYEAQYWVDANGRSSMPSDVMGVVESYVAHAL